MTVRERINIFMTIPGSHRLEIAILFYFQKINIFGYQSFSKYLQRCLQKIQNNICQVLLFSFYFHFMFMIFSFYVRFVFILFSVYVYFMFMLFSFYVIFILCSCLFFFSCSIRFSFTCSCLWFSLLNCCGFIWFFSLFVHAFPQPCRDSFVSCVLQLHLYKTQPPCGPTI